jgi:UDP-glucose-4-epimerase GalE
LGSHVCKELKLKGWKVVGLDKREPDHDYLDLFTLADIRNSFDVYDILQKVQPSVVFHFAGRIEVGLSQIEPTEFYDVNVGGTCTLINQMKKLGLNNIIYSSTAGVYEPKSTPIKEPDSKNWDNNPYAGSKMCAEMAIRHSTLKYIIFRYFNLAGADPENDIGECHDPETHLIPKTLQNLNNVEIYGNNYDTPDGTCVRDYVHVSDVALAHLLASDHLLEGKESFILNLGTGEGQSVNEIVAKIEMITKQKIAKKMLVRRDGDPPSLVADITLAKKILNYQPKYDIMTILQTAYNWHLKNDNERH